MSVENLFARLRNLQPGAPLLIGTVTAVTAAGATVQLPGGALQQARGAASIGDTVFVRGGVIEGPAPGLTLVIVDI
jgi:hypothetical protein